MKRKKYKYEELSEPVKERVYEQYLEELEQGYDWWSSILEEYCLTFKQNYGLEINPEGIYFSLSYPKYLYIDDKSITVDNWFKFITQLYKDKYINDTFRRIFLEKLGTIKFKSKETTTYINVYFNDDIELSSSVEDEYAGEIQAWFDDKIVAPLLSTLETAYEDIGCKETMICYFEEHGIRFDSEGNIVERTDKLNK